MAVKKTSKKRKKRRTAAQKAATRRLVALNKARRKKATKRVVKRKKAVSKKRFIPTVRKKRRPLKTKKRRYSTMAKRRKSTPKRRRAKRSPFKGDFVGTVINGAIAGGGAIIGNMTTNAIGKVLNLSTPQQRNILGVAISLAASYFLPRVIDKDVARSLSDGMFAISMASLASTALGKSLISLGANEPLITDYGLSAIERPDLDMEMMGAIEDPLDDIGYVLEGDDYIVE